MNKLENFPPVYWLTLKGSSRQEYMIKQFEEYGIKNHKMIEGYDAREIDLKNSEIVSGSYFHQLDNGQIGCTISHLKMIKEWYENSDSPCAIFFEDDINFNSVNYWNFTWNDVLENLPKNWNCVQLCLVKHKKISGVNLHLRTNMNWSAAAYIITREYAKRLIDNYCIGDDKFILRITGDPRAIPFIENVIYFLEYGDVYTLPIFTEQISLVSYFYGHFREMETIDENKRSSINVLAWWKKNGKKTSIEEIMNKVKSIPVIGTSVIDNTFWVNRLLMSIDYPVDNFVIINNNGRGELDQELDRLKSIDHPYVKNIIVTTLPANIGTAGSWNLIIKCFMNSPYWIIVKDDVAFTPGILEEMMINADSDPLIGLIHGYAGDFGVGCWDFFFIRDIIIQEFGLFDENLYPMFCEDVDYMIRFMHRPIRKVISLSKPYYRKFVERKDHKDSSDIDPLLKDQLDASTSLNIDYLNKKWGTDWRLSAPTILPFENTPNHVSRTTYDLNFVRKKNLGF